MAKDVIEELESLVARAEESGGVADAQALFTRLGSNGWLGGLARFNALDLEKVVRGELVFSYEWGYQFERGNKRAPGPDDWKNSYFDRANQFARKIGVLEPFATAPTSSEQLIDVGDKPDYRLRGDYGGPF